MTASDDLPVDAAFVVAHLEAAGRTLLAMRLTSPFPSEQTTFFPEIIRERWDYLPDLTSATRPAQPSARQITHMDRVLGWIALIPIEAHVRRRVVGMRCLINPINDRQVYSWRKLGIALHADPRAVQLWHGQGIDTIVHALARDNSLTLLWTG